MKRRRVASDAARSAAIASKERATSPIDPESQGARARARARAGEREDHAVHRVSWGPAAVAATPSFGA
jgi:hypothetical protein